MDLFVTNPESIGGQDRGFDHYSIDRKPGRMDGLAFCDSRCRNPADVFWGGIRDVQLFQAERKSDAEAEILDLSDGTGRTALQYKLGQDPEGYLFAVEFLSGSLQGRQAVMDRMGPGMPPVFGAQPAQQGVGLDDRLHRRRNDIPFNGQLCLQT